MKRLLLVPVAALAVAIPAASATTFTVRAGGYVQDRNMNMERALFNVNLRAGPGHKVVYNDTHAGIYFRSLHLSSVTANRDAVKIAGIGTVGGQRVHFTAVASDHVLTAGDWFTIAWDHKMSHGGKVVSGNVRITPTS